MRYEVTLRYHEDAATGNYGLCHVESVGHFNTFWDTAGIFHDVFEHYFEGQHRYFSGEYMHTIYGEMAASGAALVYNELGIDNFQYRRQFSYLSRDFTADTFPTIQNAIYCREDDMFSLNPDLCIVPNQRDPNSYNLNHWLSGYQYAIEDLYGKNEDVDPRLIVPWKHIENCYRWGYNRTDKLIKDPRQVYDACQKFLDDWNVICNQREDNAPYLIIAGSDFYLRDIKFVVNSIPDFRVKVTLIDEMGESYPLNRLMFY